MLRAARDALDELPRVDVLRSSSVYETAPQGPIPDQPDFLNACVEVDTSLDPEELLEATKEIEARLGRSARRTPQGPRPIDVDLLTYGDAEYRSERTRLPHPDITARRFVLEPLLELDPELALPNGTRLREARDRLLDQRVERTVPL
jgi:2-amino-4-hydroxy-6-hydroxymethyldihydropteridine diphosphokinase